MLSLLRHLNLSTPIYRVLSSSNSLLFLFLISIYRRLSIEFSPLLTVRFSSFSSQSIDAYISSPLLFYLFAFPLPYFNLSMPIYRILSSSTSSLFLFLISIYRRLSIVLSSSNSSLFHFHTSIYERRSIKSVSHIIYFYLRFSLFTPQSIDAYTSPFLTPHFSLSSLFLILYTF